MEERDDLTLQAVQMFGVDGAIERLAYASGYTKMPPTIEEVIENEYYGGKFIGRNSPTPLYPYWKKVLSDVFPHPLKAKYKEIALSGAIGLGKSTCCMTGMFYDLIRILHLEDPHKTFHVGFADAIIVAFINTTRSQAESKQYAQFIEWLKVSPFIREKTIGYKKDEAETPILPHKIEVVPGSRAGQYLGGAIVMGLLSELNFAGEHKKDQAFANYDTVSTRLDSRFEKGKDRLQPPGRLWLDSSKSDETGWLEQKIKHLEANPDVALVVSEAVWHVIPEWKRKYSDIKFPVFQGNEGTEPSILRDDEVPLYPPEEILWVPDDFRTAFEQDLYGKLRDVAGVSTWRSHKFIPQKYLITNALVLPNLAPVNIRIDFDLNDRLIKKIPDLSKLPKGVRYFAHWDMSTSGDRAGFALSRCVGPVMVPTYNEETFVSDVSTEMGYQTDLVMGVSPVPGKVMPITSFQNLITDLIKAGISIVGVSADGWQSTNMIQNFQLMKIPGFSARVISTDRDRSVMDHFRECIVQKRWRGPNHPILETELKQLMDHGDKVDHPVKGSKDIADASSASVYHASLSSIGGTTPVAAREAAQRKESKIDEVDPVTAELLKMAGKTLKDLYPQSKKTYGRPADKNGHPDFKDAWKDRKLPKPEDRPWHKNKEE